MRKEEEKMREGGKRKELKEVERGRIKHRKHKKGRKHRRDNE